MARIGVTLVGRIPMKELAPIAQEADQRGYHSIWLTEGSARDAFCQIAAMSMVTENVQFGPGVVVAFGRSPTMLAMITATLDEISGQRFIQGIGAGGPNSERNHGEKYEKPIARMRDYVTIIKAALRGETVDYTGKAVSIHGFRLGFRAPRPNAPVYVAALGPQMSRLGGEISDGLIYSLPTPHYIRKTAPVIKEGTNKAGRSMKDVDVAAYILCDPNPDRASARETIREHIFGYTGSPAYVNMLRLSGYEAEMDAVMTASAEGDAKKGLAAVSDRMVDQIGMFGDPHGWVERIEEFREAGVTLPILRPSNPITASAEMLRSVVSAYNP